MARFQPEYTSYHYGTVRGLEQYSYDIHSSVLEEIAPNSLCDGNIGKYSAAACGY